MVPFLWVYNETVISNIIEILVFFFEGGGIVQCLNHVRQCHTSLTAWYCSVVKRQTVEKENPLPLCIIIPLWWVKTYCRKYFSFSTFLFRNQLTYTDGNIFFLFLSKGYLKGIRENRSIYMQSLLAWSTSDSISCFYFLLPSSTFD